jgi:hypothetical protein
MNTDKELMQQALKKLEFFSHMKSVSEDTMRLITALRERLEQPEQEPVGWFDADSNSVQWKDGLRNCDLADRQPFYTAQQPQMQPCAGRNCGSTNPNLHSAECFEDYEKATGMRAWHGLTDEEKAELDAEYGDDTLAHLDAIEAKLREKNA